MTDCDLILHGIVKTEQFQIMNSVVNDIFLSSLRLHLHVSLIHA